MNTKVVQLMNIYNFYFGHFFIWQILSTHCSLILHMSHIVYKTLWEMCHICEQCHYHFVIWRNDQYKSCRSWWVIQLWYLSLFHLKIIWGTKILFEVVFFWNSKFKLLKLFICIYWQNQQNKLIENDFRKF